MNKVSAIIKTQENLFEEVMKGEQKIQTPTPTNKPPEGSKAGMGEEEKEAAFWQTLHIPSFTREEATGSFRKGSGPTEKEQRSWCGSTALMFVFQEHKERPQGNWESSEQGPGWLETSAAK